MTWYVESPSHFTQEEAAWRGQGNSLALISPMEDVRPPFSLNTGLGYLHLLPLFLNYIIFLLRNVQFFSALLKTGQGDLIIFPSFSKCSAYIYLKDKYRGRFSLLFCLWC